MVWPIPAPRRLPTDHRPIVSFIPALSLGSELGVGTMLRVSLYEEISFALSDGYAACGRYFAAVGAPCGAVLYHHGIQSHCGWYETSAQRLAESGFHVLQWDRRGSGRNERDRGHADSAPQLIADAHAARDELVRRSGSVNHHVIGISWGGKLAVAAYVEDPKNVVSLSLVTPGLFPLVGVSKAEMAKIGFAMLYEPHQDFRIPLDDPDMFTSNSDWQEFIRTDALTLRRCTASFYLASRRMDRMIQRLADSPPAPLHMLLADNERIIDNDKTRQFVRALPWKNCRITTYAEARHSLEFENDPEVYFGDLIAFIRAANQGS